jgi:D-3-phosphoglycerate dehydrogenase
MLTQFTGAFSAVNVNITDMVNKSRGDYAYTVLDVESTDNTEVAAKLTNIDGVLKVRVIK